MKLSGRRHVFVEEGRVGRGRSAGSAIDDGSAMKYQVPLRWFTAAQDGGDEVRIVDERGRPAFQLDAERSATAGDRAGVARAVPAKGGVKPAGSASVNGSRVLTFRDRRGDELGFVTRRQMPGGGSAFEIYHGDDLQAVVRRDGCSPKRCRFMADGPGPDDLHAEGDLGGREYTFTREGKPVGRVSKSLVTAAGAYGVEVGRGEDEVLMLSSVVVIDLCCQPGADAPAGDSRLAG